MLYQSMGTFIAHRDLSQLQYCLGIHQSNLTTPIHQLLSSHKSLLLETCQDVDELEWVVRCTLQLSTGADFHISLLWHTILQSSAMTALQHKKPQQPDAWGDALRFLSKTIQRAVDNTQKHVSLKVLIPYAQTAADVKALICLMPQLMDNSNTTSLWKALLTYGFGGYNRVDGKLSIAHHLAACSGLWWDRSFEILTDIEINEQVATQKMTLVDAWKIIVVTRVQFTSTTLYALWRAHICHAESEKTDSLARFVAIMKTSPATTITAWYHLAIHEEDNQGSAANNRAVYLALKQYGEWFCHRKEMMGDAIQLLDVTKRVLWLTGVKPVNCLMMYSTSKVQSMLLQTFPHVTNF